MLDRLAPPTTGVALCLDLLEHARCQLVLDDAHTMAVTTIASLNDTIGGAGAIALLADLLLVPLELGVATIVEVAESEPDLDLNVVAAGLPTLIMATSTKKAAEEIERVVVLAASSLLALL